MPLQGGKLSVLAGGKEQGGVVTLATCLEPVDRNMPSERIESASVTALVL